MSLALTSSPQAFVLTLDVAADRGFVIPMGEPDYRDASFLDERLAPPAGAWVPWGEIASAAEPLAADADFIFHIGHVGSTLLSRVMGADEAIFCLREPAVLRTFAHIERAPDQAPNWRPGELDRRLRAYLRLCGRTWRPGQRSLVKATSFVSEIGPAMLRLAPSARAILLFVSPQSYMATILAGPNSQVELRANAEARLQRLHRRVGAQAWALPDLSLGELAAMAWTCEVCALASIAHAFADRIRWLDFDDFLARPADGLRAALSRLRGAAPEAVVQAMLASPDFGRYAKATEFAYDAGTRRQLLAAARRDYRVEIERGLDWINAAGNAFDAIADGIRTAGTAPRIA